MENKILSLFHSKIVTAHECPQRYQYRYHEELIPAQINTAMKRGSLIHEAAEIAGLLKRDQNTDLETATAIALNKVTKEAEKEDVKDLVYEMADPLIAEIYKFNIIDVEKTQTFKINHPTGFQFQFRIKPDSILQDETGTMWQGEYKTTASSASTVKRLYHKGIQPWLYLYFLTQCPEYDKLAGIQLFVASKKLKRIPKGMHSIPHNCSVEPIPIGKSMLKIAEQFIMDSAFNIHTLEQNNYFFKNRSQCQNFFGECPYAALCEPKVDTNLDYRNSVIEKLFIKEDPEAHLNPTKEETDES